MWAAFDADRENAWIYADCRHKAFGEPGLQRAIEIRHAYDAEKSWQLAFPEVEEDPYFERPGSKTRKEIGREMSLVLEQNFRHYVSRDFGSSFAEIQAEAIRVTEQTVGALLKAAGLPGSTVKAERVGDQLHVNLGLQVPPPAVDVVFRLREET
jgi:hypothetical protein